MFIDSLQKELKRLAAENKELQEQLEMQRKRYEVELDSLKTSLGSVKGEHVQSLKEDFERVCNEKVQLQVTISELKEQTSANERRIDELILRNQNLGDELTRTKNRVQELEIGQKTWVSFE